ncbi:TPA: DsbA family oxidoreductase [Bacillus cereus]|uniref:DSBA-like thioredoxin domain protein n=1 Tax=Bacillus cereus 03BB108 TaxID=451709 RepID=A0AAN0SXL1_BACCE|nr:MULTISPECIES: DsbA family oxidoreductase [Bacillus cereus group]AJG58582.1 DSBA-like thioredoxin domain protein [Bacillus cereus D17]AJI11867.1 DSBA-like thioredoxin domain protein [Bacillus cereus 03BB108]EDX60112.1 FrnE protein [Bacillus cereus 03BB108]KXY96130.1 disulfide bond formation protein DsbA [Bacillus cereus]MBL3769219.1 DsbA family oxidoreductase [Bacillus cereus]
MKIEVWSDFVCPFCYIGKRRLEMALEQFPHKKDVEVEFKSFELDQNAPIYSGTSINEVLASKYGISIEEAKRNNVQLGNHAASMGLSFNFDEMKPTNTFDAHRLAKFAKNQGKEKEITENLLFAYFTESKNLSDVDTLATIAEAAGLDKEEALRVINDKKAYANDVRIDEAIAQQYQISGVPYFIINQKYAISGAQPLETFVGALQQVWEEENPAPKLQELSSEGGSDMSCTDESCSVPSKEQ